MLYPVVIARNEAILYLQSVFTKLTCTVEDCFVPRNEEGVILLFQIIFKQLLKYPTCQPHFFLALNAAFISARVLFCML